MLKKILGTICTRYLIAFLNLALIFINAKILGIEGVGMIGLIVASINIAAIFNGILCGTTIIYFMNRYSMRTVFLPAYLWDPCGSFLACGFMYITGLLPERYGMDIFFLSIINSLVNANARFLLGKDHVTGFNLTSVLQGGLMFFVLLFFYYRWDMRDVGSYVKALYITNGLAFIVSLWILLPYLLREQRLLVCPPLIPLLKEMFVYGLWSGADTLAETFTSRLTYFFMQRFGGLGSVGMLDAGTKVSESVWHISRSVGFIEYSSVAKTKDSEEQRLVTLRLLKLTSCALILVMVCILLIPEWVYTDYLFSLEFKGIRQVICGLSLGIIVLGCNTVLSSYFVGSGRVRYSTASSCIGLITLLIMGYLLIPSYGIIGAAISTSFAFTAMLIFSLMAFLKLTHTCWRELLLSKGDLLMAKKQIQTMRENLPF